MNLKYTKIKNGIATITVMGEFNTCIKREMKDEIEEILRHNCNQVVIDFQNTIYMDSVGVGIIHKIKQQFGKNLSFINTNQDILESLKVYNLASGLTAN